METCIIKERHGIWVGCLLMVAFFAAAACLRPAGWGAVIFVSMCGILVLLLVLQSGVQTKVLSSDGLCVKRIFHSISVRWEQVDKIGVVWMRLGSNPRWYISVTWQPQSNQKTWVQYWLWWMKLDNKPGLLFPYTDKLFEAIVRYYGPLDYDGRSEKSDV